MKPFLYLQNRIRTDISALLAKIIDTMGENESVESLICHSHLATVTTLVATDRKALSAQLLAVIERPSPDESSLERCLQVAFDEREEIVRGLAWVVVSIVWENPERSSMLHRLLMTQMADRFGVRLDSADLGVTRISLCCRAPV
jgi:hypothetical protein